METLTSICWLGWGCTHIHRLGGGHLPPIYLLFGATYWFRRPRGLSAFNVLTSLLFYPCRWCTSNESGKYHVMLPRRSFTAHSPRLNNRHWIDWSKFEDLPVDFWWMSNRSSSPRRDAPHHYGLRSPVQLQPYGRVDGVCLVLWGWPLCCADHVSGIRCHRSWGFAGRLSLHLLLRIFASSHQLLWLTSDACLS